MKKIEIYTTKYCGFCHRALQLLRSRNLEFNEVSVDGDPKLREEVSQRAGGYSTVPMIFIDQEFIGGFTELYAIDREGKL